MEPKPNADLPERVEDRDLLVAEEIKAGRCPFGRLSPGAALVVGCPSGLPGCACGDELLSNPFLQDPEAEAKALEWLDSKMMNHDLRDLPSESLNQIDQLLAEEEQEKMGLYLDRS